MVFISLLQIACFKVAFAQYTFTTGIQAKCTAVKNQQSTGTCWSFTTVSYLESELLRLGKGEYDLSEMFLVRTIYHDKARNYVLRQGKANFSQGGLSHDVIRAFKMGGIVPEAVYSGKRGSDAVHDHSEMEAAMKGMLDVVVNRKSVSTKWPEAIKGILDAYMGKPQEKFEFQAKTWTPVDFANSLGLNPDDYVSLTSFSHHPFYESCIVEIPDNYSNGAYYNLPLDELQAVVDYALTNGHTVAWDGDVSEKGFSAKEGIAVVPAESNRGDLFSKPGPETNVDQALRQEAFESYATTDDHLMHLVGTARDQNGVLYYLTKNSWGEISPYKGFLHLSSSYFRLKTVGIMVHKTAIPKAIAQKIKW
ncbi:MAG: aminopeptidase [Saprospiraceae bacterium]|nr:aminopeptidase [Saprospiraceae bacterium]